MGAVQVQRVIDASAEQAWDALADFGNIHRFNPLLSGAHLLSEGAECGVGTERVCDLKYGGSLHERIIEWRPGESYTVEVDMPRVPVSNVRTHMAVQPLDGERCRVSMEMQYRPRFGPAGRLLDALMIRLMMRRMLAGVLAGLERYLVPSEGTRPLSPAVRD